MTKQGDFIWYELMTSDANAARDFYAKVAGWTMQDSGMPGIEYTVALAGEHRVAGMMTMPAQCAGMKPGWVGYVAADDVDASAGKVAKLGGTVSSAPQDIPGIGRFAAVTDPQGSSFMLFKGNGAPPPLVKPGTPGQIGWHELHASDWQDAFAFYTDLFGWQKAEAIDMGEMGTYQLFSAKSRTEKNQEIGGMMTNTHVPKPFWLYYINVDDIDAALSRLIDAGGEVRMGPQEVPGPMFIIQAVDPQGAVFALVGPRR